MLLAEPAISGRNEYGFSDPTPAMARWGIVIVTFAELVAAIAEKTGEQPGHVEHLLRAWMRDGLLPKPRIVPVPGKRGTRGDYTEASIIAYLAVKHLRPQGKPLSLVFVEPDLENITAQLRLWGCYWDWLRRELGLKSLGQIEALQKANALPPPPPEIAAKLEGLAKQPKKTPAVYRMRLNTATLACLIPIARREKPDDPLFNAGEKTPRELAEETGEDAWKLYLEYKALREIWKAVCAAETGITPDRVDNRRGEVIAYSNDKEIWRLTQSKWLARD